MSGSGLRVLPRRHTAAVHKPRPWSQRLARAARAITGAWAELFGTPAYTGAEQSRLLGDWNTARTAADDLLRWNIIKLRERARDLERNNPIVRQYLRLLGLNVIGPHGMTLQAQVRNNNDQLADGINDKLEGAWAEFCERPTLDGRMDMVSFSRLLMRTVARDGEAFVRLWRGYEGNRWGFALEALDPDVVDESHNVILAPGREIRLGVEVDQYNRPQAYHVWDRPQAAYTTYARRRVAIPADQVIHLYAPDRVNQTRGVTWMASVMVPAKMLEGYSESELVAARVGAAKMLFFQRKEGAGYAVTPAANPDGSSALTMEANPGGFGVLPDGYEIADWSPDHPNAQYGSFVKEQLRRIAAGLGVSYNMLASDLESVNYSSLRSGSLAERDVWESLQSWWINAFQRPVYREWLNMALLSGALTLDSRDFRKFLAAKWTPRGWPWVDPLDETKSAVEGIASGLTSRTRVLAEQGMDLEEVFEELAHEAELAKQHGLTITGTGTPGTDGDAKGDDKDKELRPRRIASTNGHNGRLNGVLH